EGHLAVSADMVELLERVNRAVETVNNPFRSLDRVDWMREAAPEKPPPAIELQFRYNFAMELLQAGHTEQAIQEVEACRTLVETHSGLGDSRLRTQLQVMLAVCHLRLSEQENCLFHHSPDSCILPFQESAFHQIERGARGAIQSLRESRFVAPRHIEARWLLNIAHMVLGEYPDKVHEDWLIPPRVFESDYPLPRFSNVAGNVGLDQDGLAGGVVVEDFDQDGYFDLLVSEWGSRDQIRYYRNNGDGTFTERTQEAGLTGLVGGLNLVSADYNNDGHVDVLVLRGAWLGRAGAIPNSLLRNNGHGVFEDVTHEAGLLSFHPTQTATWFDFDNDGWIDLFIGNESDPRNLNPSELYRNNGDGTFTECAAEVGLAVTGYVKAVVSGDFDNDGRPDLYLSLLEEPNRLFRNAGPTRDEDGKPNGWRFEDVTRKAGVAEPTNSFPAWFWDYDNDGWLDIFVSGYDDDGDVGVIAADYLGLPHDGTPPKLYRNNRDGTFSDVTREVGLNKVLLTMGCNFGDLDNDGFLDFYVGTGNPSMSMLIPNRMFRNNGGKGFQDVTSVGGFGHLQKGHAVAFADLDRDGDQDVYASLGGAYSGDVYRNVLFENPGTTNGWLGLKLVGTRSNRGAIGARVRATLHGSEGERVVHRVVGSGGSFGANPLEVHVGMGEAETADIEIEWPASGTQQRFTALEQGGMYRIREGETREESVPLKPIAFKKPAEGHHDHHSH
ncbi:MAG TPA: VCBS repeat-containing protein, partial [Methylomirabilota bacterium]|nr:VCBS repeat-containing protein [Methylomirabilota bacterium]